MRISSVLFCFSGKNIPSTMIMHWSRAVVRRTLFSEDNFKASFLRLELCCALGHMDKWHSFQSHCAQTETWGKFSNSLWALCTHCVCSCSCLTEERSSRSLFPPLLSYLRPNLNRPQVGQEVYVMFVFRLHLLLPKLLPRVTKMAVWVLSTPLCWELAHGSLQNTRKIPGSNVLLPMGELTQTVC